MVLLLHDDEVVARLAGRRRRRRWVNEKTLHDLLPGPALSAEAMLTLYVPAPFGEVRESCFQQVASCPEAAAVWELFRNIDDDKQWRVLQKWEVHVDRQGRPGTSYESEQDSIGFALRCWARTTQRARSALRKANPCHVKELEIQILQFMETSSEGAELALELSSFHRLLAHGLVQYHGLLSRTDVTPNSRVAMIRQRTTTRQQQSAARRPSNVITCTTLLAALETMPLQGANPSALAEAVAAHSSQTVHGLPDERRQLRVVHSSDSDTQRPRLKPKTWS